MKEILITNDDGFEARGMLELACALKKIANVTIVAPSSEKSACSHSLTLTKPLRFIKLDDGFFKLDDATPSDCVYLGLEMLFNAKHIQALAVVLWKAFYKEFLPLRSVNFI